MTATTSRIGDIAEQIRGVTYRKQDASNTPQNGYVPVLRAGNITENGLVYDDLVYVPESLVSSKQTIRKNDVLIAASSGSLSIVGKAAKSETDYNGGFGAFCKVLRPSDKVDAAYFSHYFKTVEYRRTVMHLAEGANINNLRNGDLDNLQIPLPPLAEQKRIAGILDAADALRTKRRESLAELDTLLQSVFIDMFGDPVTNPMGWESVNLIDLVDPDRPLTYGILMPGPDTPGGVPYVRVVDIQKERVLVDQLRRTTTEIDSKYKRSKLKSRDLLMSIRGHVGRMAIVPAQAEGSNITQDTARIALTNSSPEFVMQYLTTQGMQHFMARRTKGVAVKGINLGDVKQLPILQPPMALQTEYSAIVQQVGLQQSILHSHLNSLDSLFASLQHQAFNGEL